MQKRYQSIFFDADETLFHFDAQQGLQRMLTLLDIEFSLQDFLSFRHENQQLWKRYQQGEITMAQLREQRFVPWTQPTGLTTTELSQHFAEAILETSTLLPGAEALIKALSDKAHLVIITNGFKEMQAPRLAKHGLEDHFELIITSEEVGLPKPHRRIFDEALQALQKVPREAVLMVGDTLEADIAGGINAGIDTCWYNPSAKPTHSNIKPTYQVQCLHQLRQRLAQTLVD